MKRIPRLFIYSLTNPLNGEIFYIGQTWGQSVIIRMRGHRTAARKMKTKKDCIIQAILLAGHSPIVEIVEEINVDYKSGDRTELYWIHQFRAWGFNLVNEMPYNNPNEYYKKSWLKAQLEKQSMALPTR